MLIHEICQTHSGSMAERPALQDGANIVSYAAFSQAIDQAGQFFLSLGLGRGERVAVYLDKRIDTVVALFGAAAAGGVFVPVNPLLKPEQVAHILKDCNVRILVTSSERVGLLRTVLGACHDLRYIVVVSAQPTPALEGLNCINWSERQKASGATPHRVIDTDMAAILYTSGSTGRPKGVVLSHRNLTAGAESVSQYLGNHPDDRILSVLPLSFDYGLSQLTTAFRVGACAVLMNYLLPRDVIRAVAKEKITGLAAVPPLWVQLAQLDWPAGVDTHLRYITNSGGAMPRTTLSALRTKLPKTQPYLMYGLTEAFRSTFLAPEELERRPDSIGKAIPNAEVVVLREDGTPCVHNEPGELVHRGALVAMGYWNDPEKTAERFKPMPGKEPGLVLPEVAVFSGDTVRMDEEGFLYFVSRRDEMIKTSGYRVSPTEVEEVLYSTQLVGEVVALGVAHPSLGQAIVLVASPRPGDTLEADALLAVCRENLPTFMVPAHIDIRNSSLPRNPNGKIDRKQLALVYEALFQEDSTP